MITYEFYPDLLKWSLEKGYPWDERFKENLEISGWLDTIKFYIEKLGKFDTNSCKNIVTYRYGLEKFKWALDNGCPLDDKILTSKYENVIFFPPNNYEEEDDVEYLDYCTKKGCLWDDYTSRCVAKTGCLNLLKFGVEKGYLLDKNICASVAFSGNLDMLKYCHELGYALDESVCETAASNNDQKMLEYCRNNGCQLNMKTSENALLAYNFKILRWLKEKNCPFSPVVDEIYNKFIKYH